MQGRYGFFHMFKLKFLNGGMGIEIHMNIDDTNVAANSLNLCKSNEFNARFILKLRFSN